jgi:hypothetical protein
MGVSPQNRGGRIDAGMLRLGTTAFYKETFSKRNLPDRHHGGARSRALFDQYREKSRAPHATSQSILKRKKVIEGAPNQNLNAGLLLVLTTNSVPCFMHTDVHPMPRRCFCAAALVAANAVCRSYGFCHPALVCKRAQLPIQSAWHIISCQSRQLPVN